MTTSCSSIGKDVNQHYATTMQQQPLQFNYRGYHIQISSAEGFQPLQVVAVTADGIIVEYYSTYSPEPAAEACTVIDRLYFDLMKTTNPPRRT